MDWIKKPVFLNIVLILGSLLITILLLELCFFFLPSLRYKAIIPLEPRGNLMFDPEVGYDITPNFASSTHVFSDLSYIIWSNEFGCFDNPYNNEKNFIYIAGDSFTWGWAPFEDKWGKIIQSNLGIRTLTCGVNGYGTRQELIKASKILEKVQKPRLIIVGYYGTNDVRDDELFPQLTVYEGFRITAKEKCEGGGLISSTSPCSISKPELSFFDKIRFFLGRHSVLYSGLRYFDNLKPLVRSIVITLFSDNWLLEKGIIHAPQSLKLDESIPFYVDHIKNIEGFKKMANEKGAKLLFVLIPEKSMVRAQTIDSNWANERVKEYLTRMSIPYIDLLPDFKKYEKLPARPLYWDFDGHWNIEGNHLAGLLVSKYLIDNDMIYLSNENKKAIEQALETQLLDLQKEVNN